VLDVEGSRTGNGNAASPNSPIANARYYAKARYYGGGRGSFLSTDPWSGDETNPLSYNKYLYGYANPGMYIDPDGRAGFLTDLRDRFDRTDAFLREQAVNSTGTAGLLGYSLARGLAAAGSAIPRALNLASDGIAQALPGEAFIGVRADGAAEFGNAVDAGVYVASNPGQVVRDIHGNAVQTTVALAEGDRGAASDAISFFGQAAGGAAAARNLATLSAAAEGRLPLTAREGVGGGPELTGGAVDAEIAALRAIGENNAGGSAATSASGFRVTVEGKASGGRGLGANQTVDRIASEYAGAVQQANRILQTNRAPATAWEKIYRGYIARGESPPEYVRGNALQQVADDLMRQNRYAQDAEIIINRQSRVDALQPLRPDVQVPITQTTQGVIDITTPGQAPKIGKYLDSANSALINVLYEQQ